MAIRGDQHGQDKVAFAAGFGVTPVADISLGSSQGCPLLGGLLLLIGP